MLLKKGTKVLKPKLQDKDLLMPFRDKLLVRGKKG